MRRHESASVRACVAAAMLEPLKREAKRRQATSTGGSNPQLTEKIPEAEPGESREKAAAIVGVNPRYVSDAKKLQAEAFANAAGVTF